MSDKLKIAFFAERCLPIHAHSLSERPLGGTETGLIRVAHLLQQRGHEVTVYTKHQNPPVSIPRYLPVQLAHRAPQFDVMVSVMEWRPAFYGIPAKRHFFWTGDSFDQYANFGMGDQRVVSRVEKFLAVSNWHADSLCEVSGFPREKTFVVGNGVQLDYFQGEEQRERKRLFYSSAPYRGLAYTPSILLEVLKQVPDVEFHVFAGLNIYDTDKPFEGPEKRQFEQIAKVLTKIPGVVLRGNILQAQLAREMMKASILFYPNGFVETSCISALEAQAAGCAVVTSERGALPETVADAGLLVSGEPGSAAYMRSFVDATVRLLKDDALWARCSAAGKKKALETYSWELVVDRFESALHT